VIAGPNPSAETAGGVSVPISFPVHLEHELDEHHVEVVPVGATGTECKGTAAEPTAPEAEEFLCVYLAHEPEESDIAGRGITNPAKGGAGAATSGAVFSIDLAGTEAARFYGTWAVTG
jgi:hypothetical protein